MNLLFLGPEEIKQIKDCMEFGDNNPVCFERMMRIKNKVDSPIGDDRRHLVFLFDGYRIAYSLEHHGKQLHTTDHIMFRHISISYKDQYPPIQAAQLILDSFQFDISLRSIIETKNHDPDTIIFEEDGRAINVLQVDKRQKNQSALSS